MPRGAVAARRDLGVEHVPLSRGPSVVKLPRDDKVLADGDSNMTPAQPTPAEPAPFLHRAIRIVALILLAYAAVHALQYVAIFSIQGVGWRYARGPYQFAERALQLSHLGTMLLLLVGAIGLLKWKPWSRPAVMLWAVLSICMSFVAGVPWLLQYARDVAAATGTTRAVFQPLWQVVLWQMLSAINQAFFPLLVWLLLRQPEVAGRFSRRPSGGFEVVPFAQAVGDTTKVPVDG
jgi:hypothetical protein